MTQWLIEVLTIWLSINVIIVATAWYLANTIKPRYPEWWRRVVVDNEPEMQHAWIKIKR